MTQSRIFVGVALTLLIVLAGLFLVVTFSFQPSDAVVGGTVEEYDARLAALLPIGRAEGAEEAFTKYACSACHRASVQGIAPSWEGIAQTASDRRPQLTAEQYLYESIVYPSAYVVEGYSNSMVQNYSDRMTDQELADMLVYLLSPEAR